MHLNDMCIETSAVCLEQINGVQASRSVAWNLDRNTVHAAPGYYSVPTTGVNVAYHFSLNTETYTCPDFTPPVSSAHAKKCRCTLSGE